MPLRNDIERLRDETLARLSDAHDYYTYTKGAWRTLHEAVRLNGLTFSLKNQATNSSVTEKDLLARSQRYVAEELASATLQQFVSIFEGFLFDVLRLWLLAHPASLSARELKGKEILALPDKEAIVEALVEKELKGVFYDRPINWFEYLNSLVKIGVPTKGEAEFFAEIKATRDILVHGQGIANAHYIEKAGGGARAGLGQVLDVPEPYHRGSWDLVCQLVRDIGTAMAAKA